MTDYIKVMLEAKGRGETLDMKHLIEKNLKNRVKHFRHLKTRYT